MAPLITLALSVLSLPVAFAGPNPDLEPLHPVWPNLDELLDRSLVEEAVMTLHFTQGLLPGEEPVRGFKPYCSNSEGDWHVNVRPDGTTELGGWVAHTAHVDADVWLSQDAEVCDNARVLDGAIIDHPARIYGDARIIGPGVRIVCPGRCGVSSEVQVFGQALIKGDVLIYDRAPSGQGPTRIYGDAIVHGVKGEKPGVVIRHGASVFGTAWVLDQAVVDGARIFEAGTVYEDAVIEGGALIFGGAEVYDGSRVSRARVSGRAKVRKSRIEGAEDAWALLSGAPYLSNADVRGGAMILGEAEVLGGKLQGDVILAENARLYGTMREHAIVHGAAWVTALADISGRARVTGKAHVGSTAGIYVPKPDECPPPPLTGRVQIRGEALVDGGHVAWAAIVEDEAHVSGGTVDDDARIFGKARVVGGEVHESAEVGGVAQVWGGTIAGQARVLGGLVLPEGDGHVKIDGHALVTGTPAIRGGWITGDAFVGGSAMVLDYALIHAGARVQDQASIYGHGVVGGHAMVVDKARVGGVAEVKGTAVVGGNMHLTDGTHTE